jgi:hypothetical protein
VWQPARSAGTPAAVRTGATSSTSCMVTAKPARSKCSAQAEQQEQPRFFQTSSAGVAARARGIVAKSAAPARR